MIARVFEEVKEYLSLCVMSEFKIRRTKGDYILLDTSDPVVAAHLSDRTSQAHLIAAQLEKPFYPYFDGKENLVVLDLGANVGLFSIHVSDCSKVFAVEPTPSHFEVLKRNIKNLKTITPLNYAISPTNGPVTFFIDESNSTMNSLVQRTATSHTISVEGVTLKRAVELTGQTRIDFCKVDMEGSEFTSITDEAVASVRGVIRSFFIETHETHGRDFNFMANHFLKLFQDNGYHSKRTGVDSVFAEI